jgi:hypothetical protein
MSIFLSSKRPLDFVENRIQHNLQPLVKSEQKKFQKWLRVTKQQVNSKDSQFAKLIADKQISWQRDRLLKQQLLRNKMLRNRSLRRSLIKAGVVQKNILPSKYYGRSVRKLHKFSFIGGTHFLGKNYTKKYFFQKKVISKNKKTHKKNHKTK